ncbi:permease-like cell division protein FtsX [Phosphitispora sp. TUW77]|uniref:permease-like cell division protein FtsX n=1 Tax=Phosphitispora sp. TUW77 TaxID=3152361 RepID=UPI003AB6ABAA
MRIRTFGYFIREACKSLYRNNWMGLASIGTVAVSLIIFGVSLISVMNANYLATRLESNVEIIAYLKDDVAEADARVLNEDIAKLPGISKVKFKSKDQALKEFRKELGAEQNMIDALGGNNPLPHLYVINTIAPEDVVKVAESLQGFKQVEKVDYGKNFVEKLFAVINWVRIVGITVIVLLGLAAIFLIATTIRLTVFNRRKEIEIMKILGATNWFIRWPFLLEGMVLGFTGALLAVLVVSVSYVSFTDYIQNNFNYAVFGLQTDPQFLLMLGTSMLGAGMFIGAVGSSISMRKFLRI